MSLGINTTTPEGIVLAADSRQSYRNRKGMSRIGSDSASKVFKIGDKMGVIVAGLAFLPENGVLKNISRFIEEFKKSGSLIMIETEIYKHLLNQSILLLHQHPLSVDVILGYMFAKDIEVRNLRIIIKGKQLGLNEEFIESQLVY